MMQFCRILVVAWNVAMLVAMATAVAAVPVLPGSFEAEDYTSMAYLTTATTVRCFSSQTLLLITCLLPPFPGGDYVRSLTIFIYLLATRTDETWLSRMWSGDRINTNVYIQT